MFMISQPRDYLNLEDLPHLDPDTFYDICRQVFQLDKVKKEVIDTIIKIMRAKDQNAIGALDSNGRQPPHIQQTII